MLDDKKRPKKIYDKKSAKVKIEQYCAYQERSQQETRDKLYDMGLHQKDVEELISELITDNFLNEERFAITYARGKFRMKQWGKIKIKQHLKLKRVSDYCIKKAIAQINDKDYLETISSLIEKKSKEIKENDPYIKKNKLARFIVGKGFEQDIVWDVVNSMNK